VPWPSGMRARRSRHNGDEGALAASVHPIADPVIQIVGTYAAQPSSREFQTVTLFRPLRFEA
jgi:hypothetical protein